jgi:uncharacterized membrane protein
MVPKRAGLAVVVAIFLLLLVVFRSPETTASVQKGFVLNLDSPSFCFEEYAFNDTSTSQEYEYSGDGNVTYWISMPGNSTVNSACMNVTGVMTPVYTEAVNSLGLRGLSVGNITSHAGNEIVVGTNGAESLVRVLYGESGNLIWSVPLGGSYEVLATDVGNVTDYPGDEIVAGTGSSNNTVFIINCDYTGGSIAWSFNVSAGLSNAVNSLEIGDLEGDGINEIVTADSSTVYAYGGDHALAWNATGFTGINGIALGDVNSSSGNETVVVTSSYVYALNSTGSMIWSKAVSNIYSVGTGNITSDQDDEIVLGTDNKIILLNSSGDELWNYSTGSSVSDVAIDDSTGDYPGNEIVAGLGNGDILTLDSNGGLIWSYQTGKIVRTVAIGNVTGDTGNEILAGDVPPPANGNLYTFNFDYFPANLSIDVGANGTADWGYSGALRDTQTATGLGGAFQYYLDNGCTGGMCNISVLFHSDGPGKLNISDLNVSYYYNASSVVSYTNLTDTWSRTWNVQVNESVGYEVRDVDFLANPDQDIEVMYIEIAGSATGCDFNGSACQTATVGSKNTCNVPDFTIYGSGPLPESFYFWDDSMASAVPVKGNESGYSYTNETDNFISEKTVNIWNETTATFYNITANTTVDDSSVRGMFFLNVSWSGQACNITPQAESECSQGNPGYSSFTCSGDTFYACRNDSFFMWVQPYSNSTVSYQAGGATNLPANLSDPNVTLNDSVWGDWFNYSVLVNDTEGDKVSVTLWYWLEKAGSWSNGSEVNITGDGTAWFNLSSDKDWVGVNKYKFQYQDFNSSGWPMHSSRNTSIYWGPLARKHSTGVVHVSGNESSVNRSESVELVVRINDTDNETWVQGNVNCVLWVTYNDSNFDEGNSSVTSASGHCVFHFTPDGSYSAGNHTWKVGVQDDAYYNDSNSTDFVLTVNGRVNVSLTEPDEGGILYRNSSNYIEAKLVDQYGLDVNQSGFNCSFWFNNTYLNSSNTTEYGHCSISWTPPCGYSRGDYIVNVTLTEQNGSYSILNGMDWGNVSLHDELDITITEPQEYSLLHRGDVAGFSSSVNDTCWLCSPGNYSVNWSVKWKGGLGVTVNKTPGYDEQVFPVIVNASYLEAQNIDIGDWNINYTKVLLGGAEVPSRVNAWNDSIKSAINWSQEYFNSYSELVFLVNQSEWENLTYEVVYNSSDEQEDFSYLENGGFESGLVSPWACFGEDCSPRYCQCGLRQEGGELNGSYSLYLSSDDTGGQPHVMGASLKASRPLGQDRIKVRYKPTGELGAGAYIRLYAGSGVCELDNTTGAWLEDVCYNTSFSSALWVNITVHDTGNGGSEDDASHVYIDYICLANSSGDCVNYHSGHLHQVSSLSQSPMNHSDNMTWTVPLNESRGLRRVVANASGSYYKHDVDMLYIYVYGWSNMSAGNISSTNCTYNDTWVCRQNASMDVFCYVRDANSSEPVECHNMSFWGDGIYIGSNTTDSDGRALINWVNSSDSEGNHTIVCNIMDDSVVFYNSTEDDSAEILFNISSGTTTGEVWIDLTPTTEAENLTRAFNRTYYLDINISNTGPSESMYDVAVEINSSVTSGGIRAEPVICPPIPPGQRCDRTSIINVTYLATEGYKDIHVNVTWTNSDTSQGNTSNATGVMVVNNTALNIIESEVNHTMPRGGSVLAGNFTVESFGNTNLLAIVFSESGDNVSEIQDWISYTPSSIASIPHTGEQLVNITVTVPDNATEGLYRANITANATGSSCSPAGVCWDYFVLNLNVSMPDWMVSETQLNKTIGINPVPLNGTIGIIQVTNNKDVNWSFAVSMEGNGTGNITVSASEFNLTALSAFNLRVYHNATGEYLQGLYMANITIANNEDAVPQNINVSVSLNVINFSISILSPNQSSPALDILPGDILNITANATLGGSPVDENITWYVRVGGTACGNVRGAYNLSDQLWYINCSAPTLSGNPINNSLNLTGYYEVKGVALSDIEDDAVVYRDTTPPQVHDIWVVGADPEGNVENATKSEIVIGAEIADNTAVNSSWAMLYYQGSHQANYSLVNMSGYWTFNFSSPLNVGDYRVVVYTNDSTGNQNDTSSLLIGYFDVYYPIDLNGTLVNKDGTAIEANFTFYKNGTLWEIHSFATNGTGGYSWTLHRRLYDIKVGFLEHELLFYNADINASAVNQHGIGDPDNLTNPITLDLYTAENTTQIGVTLPEGAENPIMVIALEHSLVSISNNTNFNLDYTQAIQDFYTYTPIGSITESDLGVYRCADWSMSERSCTGAFQNVSISADVNTVADKISFNITGASAYAVAEWEGVSENGNGNGDDDTTNGGSSSRSSSATTTTTTTLPFVVTTSIGSIRIHPGENKTYLFSVKNKAAGNLTVSLDVQGLEEFIFPEESLLEIPYNESRVMDIVVSVPDTMGTGTYTGSIMVTAAGKTQEIPITMTVSIEVKDLVSISIDVLTPNVNPGGKLRFGVELKNLALPPGFNVSLVYVIKDSERERIVAEVSEDVFLEESLVFTKSIEIEGNNPVGQYYLEIWAYFADGKSVNEMVVFNVVEMYWSSWEGRIILLVISLVGMSIMGYYGWRRYQAWRLEKARYIFPLDYRKIPRGGEDSFWIGRVAESDKRAWFSPSDLTTHLLIAGSTGAGKSVSASVFVEEALDRNIPVIVFDPTAQWTGFVKALEDQNLLKYYSTFGMDMKSVRPFKGMIFEVNDTQELLFDIKRGFNRYLAPGEITVFTLDKLKPGQYDEAVNMIIDALFGISWEESTTLKVIVVFDEVHRLLEKYGGKGGYVALEKAAREFRKWGIGIIMCSQVLADFKEAIAGNVLTEVQLNTKSITDIQKVETKYGSEYARKISRQGVGVGMIQNPKYNDGKPYFIHFRPTWHNPHKISNKEMEIYREFAGRLESIEAKIGQMKKAGKDTFDIELELKLAKDKLKQGRFRMAQIYITSLEQHLSKG